MKKTIAMLLGAFMLSVSCKDKVEVDVEPASVIQIEDATDESPKSFSDSMQALDRRYTAEEKSAFLKREGEFAFAHKIMGMQLRNDWGLWKDSSLKRYFSARGIAHADWISSALLEGWEAHLRNGSVDEATIIKKYAAKEKDWRKWNEEVNQAVEAKGYWYSEEGSDPFSNGKK